MNPKVKFIIGVSSLFYLTQTIACADLTSPTFNEASIKQELKEEHPLTIQKEFESLDKENLNYEETTNWLIDYQLERLSLNKDNNNALFLGRTEHQGANINNPGSLAPHNLVDSKTSWVFLDSADREPLSNNDVIANTEDLLNFFKTSNKDKLSERFKLIVIDSGAAEYILTSVLLNKIISWVTPGETSTLIFENLPPRVYPTCSIPFALFSEPLWERQKKWDKGEALTLEEFNEHCLRAFPNAQDVFCQIYCNTKKNNEEWDEKSIVACSKWYLQKPQNWKSLQEEVSDQIKLEKYNRDCHQLKKYFKKSQEDKIRDQLSQYFEDVSLQQNKSKNNDAPFVKGSTFNPSQHRSWWVAIGKK
jgi:hypothetical protein